MITKTKRLIQWVVDKKNKISYTGIHLIADFWGCQIIEDPKEIKEILVMAAKKGGSVPLKVITHKFWPQGITGVVLLAESHIAIHSWPEHDYVAVDIFTCGDKSLPYKAFEYLKEKFQPIKIKLKKAERGGVK